MNVLVERHNFYFPYKLQIGDIASPTKRRELSILSIRNKDVYNIIEDEPLNLLIAFLP